MIIKRLNVQSVIVRLGRIGKQNMMAYVPPVLNVKLIGQNHEY